MCWIVQCCFMSPLCCPASWVCFVVFFPSREWSWVSPHLPEFQVEQVFVCNTATPYQSTPPHYPLPHALPILEVLGLDIRHIALLAPSRAQYTVYPYRWDHMILNSLYPTLPPPDGDCTPPHSTLTSLCWMVFPTVGLKSPGTIHHSF